MIITKGAFRVNHCQFVGSDLTSAKTALHIDGASVLKNGKVEDCHFTGNDTTMTALVIDNCKTGFFEYIDIHDCLTGIQIVHVDSDENSFCCIDIGDCITAVDIDAGNVQHFEDIRLHGNTTNFDDASVTPAHIYNNIKVSLNITKEPDNFTGVTVNPDAGSGNTYGSSVEVRAAATSTMPFKIVGLNLEADANEKYEIRLTADGDGSYFDTFQFEGVASGSKTQSLSFSSNTDFIFNTGTQIKASSKSESGGNSLVIWLKIQNFRGNYEIFNSSFNTDYGFKCFRK